MDEIGKKDEAKRGGCEDVGMSYYLTLKSQTLFLTLSLRVWTGACCWGWDWVALSGYPHHH